MSKWITDRRPTIEDGAPTHGYVFDERGNVVLAVCVTGPWKPIPKCEPYVKPKRFRASWDHSLGWWRIDYEGNWFEHLMRLDKQNDECRAAAERIAAIYEEVMP